MQTHIVKIICSTNNFDNFDKIGHVWNFYLVPDLLRPVIAMDISFTMSFLSVEFQNRYIPSFIMG